MPVPNPDPPKKKGKKLPVKRKLPYDMTASENEAECDKQLKAWIKGNKEAAKQKQLEEMEAEKNKDRPQKLKAFIEKKEAEKRQEIIKPLLSDYDRSLHKSLKKKRQGGSPNSYIDQVPGSTMPQDYRKKKKATQASTSTKEPSTKKVTQTLTSAKEPSMKKATQALTSGVQTYVASGLTAPERALALMPAEQVAHVIQMQEATGLPLEFVLGHESPPRDKNFVPRWHYEHGKSLVRPELVKKLPTQMRRFHDFYMKTSKEGLEMIGMLVRPDDFAGEGEKLVWLRFKDIYEIYHLDSLNTDLIMA